MKSVINTAAAVITISAIAMGTAYAMIPKYDLNTNSHPDVGISAQLLSDIEQGTSNLPGLTNGADKINPYAAAQRGTEELRKLVGKHFI